MKQGEEEKEKLMTEPPTYLLSPGSGLTFLGFFGVFLIR
jgi:hypothetical protein